MILVFSTHNDHKLKEVQKLMDPAIRLVSLRDLGIEEEIEENGKTFAENASLKSSFIYKQFGKDCFADDSGLEVDALNDEPGIYSARYSGSRDMQKNTALLLENLKDKTSRKARFICMISLIKDGTEYFFEGKVEGIIREAASGTEGFGYDPLFQPNNYDQTFAEMPASLKNQISHRGIAIRKLNTFLITHGFIPE